MAPDAVTHQPGTTDPQSAAAAPLQIHTARVLHEALTAGEPSRRFGALQAVAAQPAMALALGLHAGRDIIDVLLQQAARTQGKLEWMAWVRALAAFRDARVTVFFTDILRTQEQPEILFLAARFL